MKVVRRVTSPVGLPYASLPAARYSPRRPAVTGPAGVTVSADVGPGVTSTATDPLTVRPSRSTEPVTVCAPARVAVQVAPEQEPSGAIVNVASAVRSPTGFPQASVPVARKVRDVPAPIVPAGATVSVISGPAVTRRGADRSPHGHPG